MRLALICAIAAGCAHPSQPAPVPAVAAPQPAKNKLVESSAPEVAFVSAKKVLATARDEIQSCYEAVLTRESHPDIALTIRLNVRKDGIVHSVEILEINPDIPGLVACFSGVLADLRFPRDSENWQLEFPLKLISGGFADPVTEPADAAPGG
jgi:hypothetical protein